MRARTIYVAVGAVVAVALVLSVVGENVRVLAMYAAVVVVALLAFGFVVAGEGLINKHPTIRRFREAHDRWGNLAIDSSAIPRPCLILDLWQRRFEELSDSHSPIVELGDVRNRRFGDVVTVVSYRDRYLRDVVRELRLYTGVFLILVAVGILLEHGQLNLAVIPFLEIFSIILVTLRFFVLTQSMNYLLEGD